MSHSRIVPFLAMIALLIPAIARAQPIVVGNNQNNVGGVYIDTDGTVKSRQTDTTSDLAAQRLRAKALNQPPKAQALTYVSLPRVIEQVKALTEAGKEIPDDLKYLSGLTQVRYVFVFPQEKDLVIAGTSEPFDAANRLNPMGKFTGRPVLHLEDLVTALRIASAPHMRPQPFGCSIDPQPDALARSTRVMQEHAADARGARMKAMKEGLGPQSVSTFGAPSDTRFAFVTVAADYKLKRMCLGMDAIPVPGVGSAIDNSRAAGNRFWFEANYAPLLVSEEGDAFEIRGQRLLLKAGALQFDDKGATDTAKTFARNFTAKIPQLATMVPVFADLQNVADLSLIAHLIQNDKLDQKASVDLSWILAEKNFKTTTLPTPHTADTIVNFTSGSIVAGGVTLDMHSVVKNPRDTDAKKSLKDTKSRPAGDAYSKTVGEGIKDKVQ